MLGLLHGSGGWAQALDTGPMSVEPSRDHPKIQNVLEGFIQEWRVERRPSSVEALPRALSPRFPYALRVKEGQIQVVIVAVSSEAAAGIDEAIADVGGHVTLRYEEAVQAWLSPSAMEELADREDVVFIRPPVRPFRDGEPANERGKAANLAQATGVVSEGVAVIGAPEWHRAGFMGEGQEVAILDGEFGNYRSLLGRELPPSDRVNARSFRSDGRMLPEGREDELVHGTAVAEIIHDIAPRASLYLVTYGTDVEYRRATEWAISQRPDVISTSWWWASGCFRGGGLFEPLFERARRNGILYSASAGNNAAQHWRGAFTDQDGDGRHDFTTADESITVEVEIEEIEWKGEVKHAAILGFVLGWDAPCSDASDDYDIETHFFSAATRL